MRSDQQAGRGATGLLRALPHPLGIPLHHCRHAARGHARCGTGRGRLGSGPREHPGRPADLGDDHPHADEDRLPPCGVYAQRASMGITLFVNWAIKPFTMALLGWLFIKQVFAPRLPAAELDSYMAGLILLGAAPCTAMVFVWSNLCNGNANFTDPVALNDVVMVFAFAPIVALLLGVSSIPVPWDATALGGDVHRHPAGDRPDNSRTPAQARRRAFHAATAECNHSPSLRCWPPRCCCSLRGGHRRPAADHRHAGRAHPAADAADRRAGLLAQSPLRYATMWPGRRP